MLKTAVIGLGMGLNFHIPQIVSHKKFELAAIADVDEEKLRIASEKYNVPGYTDAYEMMDTVPLDLVVIASPTQFHAPHSIAAMERGIDVFLEKPMASTLEEAKEIYDVHIRTGRKIMVYQPHRTFSETVAAKAILDSGILGRVYRITRSIRTYFKRSSWQAYKKNGGGTLNNHGSHYIDLLLYLAKGNAVSVKCELQRILATGDADDCARILMKTDNDIVLDIDMNFASAFNPNVWELYGDLGTAVLVHPESGKPFFRARYLDLKFALEAQKYYPCTNPLNDNAEYPWMIKDFEVGDNRYAINIYDKCYEYFKLNQEPFVPITDTLKVMDVLKRCHADSMF
ncbi:MAG: Gfo/Idh/MocA family protein [Caldicoprobacterales bacterium]|nr:Gfo/Idh/MocA family oxidoreductase [Clostridiales bacterium]